MIERCVACPCASPLTPMPKNVSGVIKRKVFLKSHDDWLSRLPTNVIIAGLVCASLCFLFILSLMIVIAQNDYNALMESDTSLVTNPQWKVRDHVID